MTSSRMPEPVLLLLLAVLVGSVGGLGAVVFRLMIRAALTGFHALLPGSGHFPHYTAAVLPVMGLLLVGLITTDGAREVRGHGVPQILEALALRGGRIRPRVGVLGIVAPAITIGSGGSVGREGPIALIGAAFGSSLGQLLKLADRYTILLVGCGAAAGIGATFNAPIAGGLFGMEVVLGSCAMGTLVPCFVSSVIGVTVFNAILGSHLVLPVPALAFRSPLSVVVMAVLGLVAGLFGVVYTKGLTFFEDVFDRWNWWFWERAIAGGLAVGGLGLLLRQVLGVGYEPMRAVAAGQLASLMLAALLAGKLFATLVTIGAGGSAGVFTWASCWGPSTAWRLMASCPIRWPMYFVYGSLVSDTMYTVRLPRRGIRILRGAEVRPLQGLPAKSAMRPTAPVTGSDTVSEAQSQLADLHADGLVIQDALGRYLGVVDLPTLLAASAGNPEGAVQNLPLTRIPRWRRTAT